jgi:hypothetical protein
MISSSLILPLKIWNFLFFNEKKHKHWLNHKDEFQKLFGVYESFFYYENTNEYKRSYNYTNRHPPRNRN